MIKPNGAAKTFAEKAAAGPKPAVSSLTPEEGARLIRAFVAVRNPRIRKAIVAFIEDLA